ncbi:MAG TPA: PD-(D/E)XK nuclease family protein [Chloroflexota bacterium]|nr:PD-(D/E)XK nuclease family protein [Chloroflexota bacterium]
MQVDLVRPGPASLEWLTHCVARAKVSSALDPVTVVLSNYVLGRAVQRHLGRAGGVVNVRPGRLADLAVSVLGGPANIPDTLNTSLEMGAARSAVQAVGGGLRALAHHYPLYQELLRLFRELRRQEVEPGAIAELPNVSEATVAAAAAYQAFRHLTADYADATDIRQLASAAFANRNPAALPLPLEGGGLGCVPAATFRSLREIGAIIVYLPPRLDPADVRLLTQLAALVDVRIGLASFGDLADPDNAETRRMLDSLGASATTTPLPPHAAPAVVRIVRAPDPAEEVREIVRRVVEHLEHGIPLPRQAILYRQTDPYAVLVRETLDRAGLEWCALDGQPLSETLPGRALLAVLRIGETDFAREAVLAWLTTMPESDQTTAADSSEWDRLTRDANVVRGARQWQQRLEVYATELDGYAAQREREGATDGIDSARRKAVRARAVAQQVLTLAAALTAPQPGVTWRTFVDWAEHLRVRFALPAGGWPALHARAAELVQSTLAELAEADRFPDQHPLRPADFLTTLEAALAARSVPEGKLGVGIVVGPVQSATGFAFDRVSLVGLVEGTFPPSPATDPFFPDEAQDPLERAARQRAADRRAFLSVLSAADGGAVTFGTPESTAGRAAWVSRWLLEAADPLVAGSPLDAMRFRRLAEATHPWLRIVHSSLDGLRRAPAVTDLDERRLQEAAAWRDSGRSLSDHALGRRTDLPVGAGLEFVRLRRSNQFTAFDGNLATMTDSSRLRSFVDGTRELSPTALEVWAACPYRFFLQSVLHVAPTEDPEEQWTIDAAEKGSLVHDVLERFFSELAPDHRPRGGEAYTPLDLERLERVAHARLRQAEATGDAGHPLVWEATRRELLADLRTFLDRDTEWRRSHGMDPTYFEQAFGQGKDWPPVQVPVDGGVLRLRGRMDRVDLSTDGRHAFIFDYKTGSSSRYNPLTDPIEAGKRLQLAIYARAVKTALGETVDTDAAYWFISSRGEFKRIKLPEDEAAVSRRLDEGLGLIAQGITSGVFPAVPGSDDYLEDRNSNCQWCPYDAVCPSSRDQDWQRKQTDGCASFVSLATLSAPEPAP